jgi:hypothetical protein
MIRTVASPQLTNIGDDTPAGRVRSLLGADYMKTLWILAAAATFAACHNRSQDETGAAPDKGDTTSVKSDTSMIKPSTGYDTTSVKTDTSMTKPSTGYDTTSTTQPTPPPSAGGYDTTSTTQPTTPPTSGGGYDTTSTTQPTSPSMGTDTTMSPGAGGVTPDSASQK